LGLALAALLAAVLAACGGTSSGPQVATATGGGGSTSTSPTARPTSTGGADAFKFAQCMRDNGIEDFPDPKPGGGAAGGPGAIRAPEGEAKAKLDAATEKCRRYLPNGGEAPRSNPQQVEQMRKFAQCMRANGIEEFPDPKAQGGMGLPPGVDPQSEQFKAAEKTCQEHMPRPTNPARPGGGGR
jgi:hypothetical protein